MSEGERRYVYVVQESDYENRWPVAVFTSRDAARRFASSEYSITEFPLMESDPEPVTVYRWRAVVTTDGRVMSPDMALSVANPQHFQPPKQNRLADHFGSLTSSAFLPKGVESSVEEWHGSEGVYIEAEGLDRDEVHKRFLELVEQAKGGQPQ